jgi:hypothetical protein
MFAYGWRSRIPARREDVLGANDIFPPLIGKAWASGTIPRPRDEDAIPPSAGRGGCHADAGCNSD